MTRVDSPLLTFREAKEEACLTCADSPCCKHLNVRRLDLDTLADLDYAIYLLNFEGIYLTLVRDTRTAQVFFYQSCGKLDAKGLCSVHGTGEQPAICKAYRSHDCGYRRAFGPVISEEPLLDRPRMEWLVEHLTFDEDRRVVGRPLWHEVLAAFTEMPVERVEATAPTPGVTEGLQIRRRAQPQPPGRPHQFDDPGVARPCDSCSAWCCQSLVFPRDPPSSAKELEFLRYCLGFPSVEVKITDGRWALVVHTACRHLEGGRCGVFGREERPIVCREYDEFNCEFKAQLGPVTPDNTVRVGPGEFPRLVEGMVFDEVGRLRHIPPVAAIRRALDSGPRPAPVPSLVPDPVGSNHH